MNMKIEKKYPLPSPQEEDLEQALTVLWALFENGETSKDRAEEALGEAVRHGILEETLRAGYARERNGALEFSSQGKAIARDVIRRHRLTERLLRDVLEIAPDQIDPNACRMEHVVTRDVEEAICTLLGHPPACPHGLEIPTGRCCERSLDRTGPIVAALDSLSSGQEGRIAYLSRRREDLHPLLALGLSPGVAIRVAQTSPAFVVAAGETMLALEPELARHIFVRRTPGRAG